MAAGAASVKGLDVLKYCCNLLNVSHNAGSKTNVKPMLECIIKMDSAMQKG
jgi:hypothetical protein